MSDSFKFHFQCLQQVKHEGESDKLKRCAAGAQGDILLAAYGDKTDAVQRPLSFVPTVVISEVSPLTPFTLSGGLDLFSPNFFKFSFLNVACFTFSTANRTLDCCTCDKLSYGGGKITIITNIYVIF